MNNPHIQQNTGKQMHYFNLWLNPLSVYKCRRFRGSRGSAQPGSAAFRCSQLDTRLGLNTASVTDDRQVEDREHSMEMIYSGSGQDYDLRDERTQQAGTEEGSSCRGPTESRTSAAGDLTLWIKDLFWPNQGWLSTDQPRLFWWVWTYVRLVSKMRLYAEIMRQLGSS